MADLSTDRARKLHDRRAAEHLCLTCGIPELPCTPCRERNAERARRFRRRRKKLQRAQAAARRRKAKS